MLKVKPQATALADVNYLVVGLGLTGYSVVSFLHEHGYRCRVQDTREMPPYFEQLQARFEQVDFRGGELDSDLIGWADVIVVSPGLSVRQPQLRQAAEQGKAILGDVELFARLADAPVVAITGSNGKSTVTTLVGAMIARDNRKVAVGGNIGTPVLDLLAQEPEFYVLELSSYQLETTTSLAPRVAALLNLCEDHLDRYDDYADYIEIKRRIYRNATLCVSNLDDVLTRHDSKDVRFSLEPSSDAEFRLLEDNGILLGHGDEEVPFGVELLRHGQDLLRTGVNAELTSLASISLDLDSRHPDSPRSDDLPDGPPPRRSLGERRQDVALDRADGTDEVAGIELLRQMSFRDHAA